MAKCYTSKAAALDNPGNNLLHLHANDQDVPQRATLSTTLGREIGKLLEKYDIHCSGSTSNWGMRLGSNSSFHQPASEKAIHPLPNINNVCMCTINASLVTF